MRNFLRLSLMVGLLLGCTSFAGAQVSVGIHIGAPPAVRVEHAPPRPGPEYIWVKGYWYPVEGHYVWHGGYWSRPPYEGAHWVGPHRSNGQFYAGYWDGSHGRVDHDHSWDNDHDRDYNRYH
jgi:YXWGXW repeat-containing protein